MVFTTAIITRVFPSKTAMPLNVAERDHSGYDFREQCLPYCTQVTTSTVKAYSLRLISALPQTPYRYHQGPWVDCIPQGSLCGKSTVKETLRVETPPQPYYGLLTMLQNSVF